MPGDDAPNQPLIIPFRHGPFVNVSYLVACIATGRAMLIDPAWDAPGLLDAVRQRELRLTHVALTHAHHDHSNGVAEVVAATGATVIGHEEEAAELRKVFDGPIDTATTTFALGAHQVAIYHTPGHSTGSLCVEVSGNLFTGDTLSIGAPGRPGFREDSPSTLWASTRLIATSFHPDTLLHPGHDAGPTLTSTLAHELQHNPALTSPDYAAFVHALERLTGRDFGFAGDQGPGIRDQ